MDMTRCSFPVRGPGERRHCGHRAIEVVTIDRGERVPLCRRHATREAHELAAERGYRVESVQP